MAATSDGQPRPNHAAADVQGVAGKQLSHFVDRIERLNEEKRRIAEEIKEAYAELKGNGFDAKIVRQIIIIRRMDQEDYDEQLALRDLYMRALGMLPDLDD